MLFSCLLHVQWFPFVLPFMLVNHTQNKKNAHTTHTHGSTRKLHNECELHIIQVLQSLFPHDTICLHSDLSVPISFSLPLFWSLCLIHSLSTFPAWLSIHTIQYSQSNRCEFSASTHFHACRAKMMMMMMIQKKKENYFNCAVVRKRSWELTAMPQMIYDASNIAHLKSNNISTKRGTEKTKQQHQQLARL